MVNLTPITFLSIGYTLLVVALNLAFLRYEVRGGKDLRRKGLFIMGLAVILFAGAWVFVWLTQALSSQEWAVFRSTTIGVTLTGLIPALRGIIQEEKSAKERKKKQKCLGWGMLATVLIGVAFIAAFVTCALKLCC
jgi:CDP-diglyceride synthetase